MIWLLFILELIFEAGWDAQAFAEGQSNHIYKILMLTTFIPMLYILYRNPKSITLYIILIIGYICLRFAMFDQVLNSFRGLDLNYIGEAEVIKQWLGKGLVYLKWIFGVAWVIIVMIYYKELEYLHYTK